MRNLLVLPFALRIRTAWLKSFAMLFAVPFKIFFLLLLSTTNGIAQDHEGYLPIMVATQQRVHARLLQPLFLDGRYAVAQTRVAETLPTGQWRFSTENIFVVDCAAPMRRVALVQQAVNTQMDVLASPHWKQSLSGYANGAGIAGMSLAALQFQSLPVPNFESTWPQPLQVPKENQVLAEFACRAASLPNAMPWPVAEVAAIIRETGGYDDVQALKCQANGRTKPDGISIEIRHSPAARAVRLGEKWVEAGTLYEDHLALTDGDLELRLTRASGTLRLVLRSEMKTVAIGVCRTLPPPNRRISSG